MSLSEKVSLAVARPRQRSAVRGLAWLKKAEINTLKSL